MENWEKEVKEYWNEVSDSEWYNSLRTEKQLKKLKENPESAFHPEVFLMLQKIYELLCREKDFTSFKWR